MAFLWLDPGSASCFLIYAVSQLATYIVGMLQATAISTRELTTVDTEAQNAIHLLYSNTVCLPGAPFAMVLDSPPLTAAPDIFRPHMIRFKVLEEIPTETDG